jgi:general secretion pathway protein D
LAPEAPAERAAAPPGFNLHMTSYHYLNPMKRDLQSFRWILCLALLSFFAISQASAQQTGATRSASRSSTRSYPSTGAIGDAYFSIDPETRRVVTIADEDTTKYISQVLSNLDRPKPQVLIKVVFLEVLHNNSLDIGVEGGWRNSIGDGNTGSVAQVFGLSGLATAAGSNGPPLNLLGQNVNSFAPVPPGAGVYQLMGENYLVTLRAIAQAGKARVLSRPSILARNNQPATITVGQSIPLITDTRYDTFGNAINSVRYQDVGVILSVTPFITPDGMVEMIVSPQISSLDTSLTIPISPGVTAPVINVRSADTVVVTPDARTVIIGGLISTTKASAETKIPLLGDIPWLGSLFRHRTSTGQDTELMIFLTPYIVEAPTQLAAVSNREIRKSDGPSNFKEAELNKFLDGLPTEILKPDKSSKKKSGSPPKDY